MLNASLLGIGWLTVDGAGRGRDAGDFRLCAGVLPELQRQLAFPEPDRRFGRLDGFSRLGLLALALALQDAGLDHWEEKRPIGIYTASRHGCLTTDLDYFATALPDEGRLASPNLFAYTLANSFLGEVALRFGLTGPGVVYNETGAAPLESVVAACEGLAWDGLPAVVTGFVDLPPAGSADPPGAAFLVLGPGERLQGDADLRWDSDRSLQVGGTTVRSWEELIRESLRLRRRTRKERD